MRKPLVKLSLSLETTLYWLH